MNFKRRTPTGLRQQLASCSCHARNRGFEVLVVLDISQWILLVLACRTGPQLYGLRALISKRMKVSEVNFLAVLAGFCFMSVHSTINSKYMTFYIPEYARRYIYLEGKYSYSVQLVLHKGDHSYHLTALGGTGMPSSGNKTADPIEFIIKAPEFAYYGIMAVVQNLHLRRNPFSLVNNGCRDYIEFFTEDGKLGSSKICGKLLRGDKDAKPSGLLGPRAFFNPKGTIKLKIHVDSAVSHEDYLELNTIGAEIVFTAYTTCPGTEVGLKTLRRCSSDEPLSCIPSALICDSKLDCGFDDQFGSDEDHCYFPYIYAAVGLLLILLVLIVIYGFIHWVRMKSKRAAEQGGSCSRNQEEPSQGVDAAMCAVESVDMDASMAAF